MDRILYCSDTWRLRADSGLRLPNEPVAAKTVAAIEQLQVQLLGPLERKYGPVRLTYGFAGPALQAAVRRRAREAGRRPSISPSNDQHAGHELNRAGERICRRDGIAVDLMVPGVSSDVVAQWVVDRLPFDRIYLYAPQRHFHLSWAPEPLGQVVRLMPRGNGLTYPKILRRSGGQPLKL